MKKENKQKKQIRGIEIELQTTNRLLGAILKFLVKYYTPVSKKQVLETLEEIREKIDL